jgi:hypothetical protein
MILTTADECPRTFIVVFVKQIRNKTSVRTIGENETVWIATPSAY